eukprot:scaffold7221_cov165-Amphora_coffeaeformis.AAC.7
MCRAIDRHGRAKHFNGSNPCLMQIVQELIYGKAGCIVRVGCIVKVLVIPTHLGAILQDRSFTL